jgi:hypothetical protein
MADQKETTVTQSLIIGQMVTAEVIPVTPIPETAPAVQRVRTVATSMTTGNVSIRYVPRPAQSGDILDTTA